MNEPAPEGGKYDPEVAQGLNGGRRPDGNCGTSLELDKRAPNLQTSYSNGPTVTQQGEFTCAKDRVGNQGKRGEALSKLRDGDNGNPEEKCERKGLDEKALLFVRQELRTRKDPRTDPAMDGWNRAVGHIENMRPDDRVTRKPSSQKRSAVKFPRCIDRGNETVTSSDGSRR